MNICIIPARGGSKRIPQKNIKPFMGLPMISYPINLALASNLFDLILVSTDDTEIAEIAVKYGASVPFMRPANLSDDFTPTVPVIRHAIESLTELQDEPQVSVCCLYPCTPLLEPADLILVYEVFEGSKAPFAFPVLEFPSPIQRALKRDAHGATSPFFPEHKLTRTQDLEPAYYDAGQFYWGAADAWIRGENVHELGIGVVFSSLKAVDIDTEPDWQRAEKLALLKE
jgi:pseudaminic acid cytidylyltransferase